MKADEIIRVFRTLDKIARLHGKSQKKKVYAQFLAHTHVQAVTPQP